MLGIVKITGGILCGCALSQFPEFSQQYVQRMGGALDELHMVVSDFDSSAADAGYTREQALLAMTGSDFLDARQNDNRRTFKRYEKLNDDYARLKGANAFSRLAYVMRMRDVEVFYGTQKVFKPALPISFEGLGCIVIGFVIGYGIFAGLLRLVIGRRKQVEA